MSVFKDYKVGDRVKVVESLYGILDGKKGTVMNVFENSSQLEVVLDMNVGKVGEKTMLKMESVELIAPIEQKEEQTETKVVNKDGMSIDDRLDSLETILNKYGLSVKDSCGFMYVYDFLDEISSKWSEIGESDKEDIVFCMIGENLKNVK